MRKKKRRNVKINKAIVGISLEDIKKKKTEVSIEQLCKGYPDEFKEYMHYCRGLSFT